MATYNQLSYGSKGSDVTELQKMLNKNGYGLAEDGIFGNKTQAAVKDYQQKNRLAVDGIVGNSTWGALTKASAGAAAPQPTAPTNTGFKYDAYQESDAVKQAQAMLQQQLAQKPGAYQSAWQTQLNDTINKILNREKFSYDLNGDALYQQYKDQYTANGRMAMMDTMGQAATMTGGYGNSYAQSVGQQAYNGYLQQLNDKVPELYKLALDKYKMEGDALGDQAALLAQFENLDYGRYRDQLSDYNNELNRLQNRYDAERDFGYGQYIDNRNYQYQQYRDKIADEQWQKQFDEALRKWNFANKQGEYAPAATPTQPKQQPQQVPVVGPEGGTGSEDTGDKYTYSDVALTAGQMIKNGKSKNDIYQYISSIVNSDKYQPTNSAKQDLAELKSSYVGAGR